ncbi:MAG: MBL fold metallo-hydrolase [Tissierellales bacterium]
MKKHIITLLLIITILLLITGCENLIALEGERVADVNYEGKLVVHFLDVGQADSILIQMPNGTISLIDGGNRGDAKLIIDYIKELNIQRIDYLIATHPHEDHIGGLPEIIKSFDIINIYMPKVTASTKIFESLLTEIQNEGLKIKEGKSGVDIIAEDGLAYSIIAPNSFEYKETNDFSIVTRLNYKESSFIFTGDAEKPSEDEMIVKGYDLTAKVLKVGHHGGRTSTSKEFLDKINPDYAVISVEKGNDYGHPHKETIKRLQEKGIDILRTDEMGTIVLVSEGNSIAVEGIDKNKNDSVQNSTENLNTYIGNKNTKVYHSDKCSSLPNKENQIEFNSINEAENAGYKPHQSCIDK